MTTSALSPITLDASELERIDRFVNVGLVHIEQLSALCRLLNRAQPDGEAYEQSEADLLTVVEGMLPLLDTVRISFEELRSILPPSLTEATQANAVGTLSDDGTEVPTPHAVSVKPRAFTNGGDRCSS